MSRMTCLMSFSGSSARSIMSFRLARIKVLTPSKSPMTFLLVRRLNRRGVVNAKVTRKWISDPHRPCLREEEKQRNVHGAAADDTQKVAGEAERGESRTSETHARSHSGNG